MAIESHSIENCYKAIVFQHEIDHQQGKNIYFNRYQSILRTFFERQGLTKKATNCLNVSVQLHLKRFMAYDKCH